MKSPSHISLLLCAEHLQALFRALERGDVDAVYQIEHKLTPEEECVACAYSLRAHGKVRQVLDAFLQKEGYLVAAPQNLTYGEEIRYWLVRIGLLTGLILLITRFGVAIKSWLTANRMGSELGAFGWVGAVISGMALFILVDSWLLED